MINIGGARPGVTDMSSLGQPAKYSYCLAEAEEQSPFSPLHTALGFTAEDSVVTVIGCEGPHSFNFVGDSGDDDAACLLALLARAIMAPGALSSLGVGGTPVVVVLNPPHARLLAEAGFDRRRLQNELTARCVHEVGTLLQWGIQGKNPERSPAINDPERVVILVAGGPSTYSAIMPGMHPLYGNRVSRVVHLPGSPLQPSTTPTRRRPEGQPPATEADPRT
jgi:hypothetical protein